MNAQACECSSAHLNPAEHFLASGKIHIFLVLNLGSFIMPQSRKDFERLRGGQAFSESFRILKPEAPFTKDREENETLRRGREFSVFRGHLVSDWLFPTFILEHNRAKPPDDTNLKSAWEKFEFRIRLSRTGFLEIKLTLPIPVALSPNQEVRLIDIIRHLLQIGSRDVAVRPAQWELGLYCANQFIRALPEHVSVREADKDVAIGLQPWSLETSDPLLRNRYTLLFFDQIWCKACGNRIDARTFWTRDKKILCAVLEGALVHAGHEQFFFPELDRETIRKFEDLGTWENELCIFAPERSLIYYPPEHIFLPGQEASQGPVKYEEYWKCIVRGIEHTITVRTALQLLEWHTTCQLDEVPHLTKKITDGNITVEDEQNILHMADEISNTFNMLPILRDVLVPTTAFRASFAVNKFEYLNGILSLKDMQAHIERNVDELVIFLNHFTSVQLQAELQRGELAIGIIGILITAVAFLAAGPSFLQDFHSFFVEQFGLREEHSFVAFIFMGLFLGFITLAVSYYFFVRRHYQRLKIRRNPSQQRRRQA